MPRPIKLRRICEMPISHQFRPTDYRMDQGEIIITLDEYEAIRLIDLEELSQEECCLKMNIARTTVQSIYAKARKKIATAIVNAQSLRIEGGNYRVCDGQETGCYERGCHRHRNRPMN